MTNNPMMSAANALILKNLQDAERSEARRKARYCGDILRGTSLNEISGIGEKTKELLISKGFDSVEKLLATPIDEVLSHVTNPISKKQVSDFHQAKSATTQTA